MKIDKTNKNTVQLDTKFIIVHSVFVVKIKIEYFGILYYYTSKNIIENVKFCILLAYLQIITLLQINWK